MIREGTEADYPELLRIGRDFYEYNHVKDYVEIDEESLKATFQVLKDHILLVLEIDGKVHGAAAGFVAPLYWNLQYLQGMEMFWWIDPEYRNVSNGKELKEALEDAAKAKGVKFWNMIALESSSPEKVGAIYKASGYLPTEHTYMKVL